jgi:hypothetical protein
MATWSDATGAVQKVPGIIRALVGPDPIQVLRQSLRETVDIYEKTQGHEELAEASADLSGLITVQASQLVGLSRGPLNIIEPHRRRLGMFALVVIGLWVAEWALLKGAAHWWWAAAALVVGAVAATFTLMLAFVGGSMLRGPHWVVIRPAPPEVLEQLQRAAEPPAAGER